MYCACLSLSLDWSNISLLFCHVLRPLFTFINIQPVFSSSFLCSSVLVLIFVSHFRVEFTAPYLAFASYIATPTAFVSFHHKIGASTRGRTKKCTFSLLSPHLVSELERYHRGDVSLVFYHFPLRLVIERDVHFELMNIKEMQHLTVQKNFIIESPFCSK